MMKNIRTYFRNASLGLALVFLAAPTGFSQQYNDGPIQLQARVRDIRVTLTQTNDFNLNIGSLPLASYTDDEYTFKMYGRDDLDIDGVGYTGGACLQAGMALVPNVTPDFNYTFFNFTYPGAPVPQFLDVNIDAFEDDRPTDFSPVAALNNCDDAPATRCAFDGLACCVNIPIFGCVFSEADDIRCNPAVFKDNLNYRLGTPCSWYDHGYLVGACASNVYEPHVQTFWRYTRGTGCGNAITLGNVSPGFTPVSHFNSNECYSNNWAGSAGQDVFYEINVTSPVGLRASLCAAATYNTTLYILNSSCTQIGFNDDACASTSEITMPLCTPGTYYIVVDAATAAAMGTFTLTLSEDPSVIVQANAGSDRSICVGTSAPIGGSPAATGGLPGYSYAWSNGTSLTNSGIAGPIAFPSVTTIYTLSVTDALGCVSTDQVTVNVNPGPPVNIGPDQTVCPGTPVPLNAGAGYVSYFWSNGTTVANTSVSIPGTYFVAVIDVFGCIGRDTMQLLNSPVIPLNLGPDQTTCATTPVTLSALGGMSSYAWNTGASTQNITVSTAGSYHVTVTNASGCTERDTINVSVNALPTPALGPDITTCPGSPAVLDAGTGYVSYAWSNGGTNQTTAVGTAGTYTVTVTDANGCTGTDAINVALYAAPAVNLGPDAGFCVGSSQVLDAGPGFSSYLWSDGSASQTLNVTFPGTYYVTVTDANGCTGTDAITLSPNTPPALSLGNDTTICTGASLNLDAGAGMTTYAWSTGSATQTLNITTAGTYSVTITDANGCSSTDAVTVALEPTPTPALGADFSLCTGEDSLLDAGAGYASYLWSTGSNSQVISASTAGTYTVTVTTAGGCTGTDAITIGVLPSPTVNLGPDAGLCDGSTALLDAGAGASSYQWSTGDVTQTLTAAFPGTYIVTVTNASGCSAVDQITLTPNAAPAVNLGADQLVCPGGSVTLDAGAGQPGYAWSTGATSQTLTVTTSGTYTVTVTGANGCTATDDFTLSVDPGFTISLGNDTTICDQASLMLDAGTGPGFVSYAWNPGSSVNQYLNVIAAGTYSVTVTNENGCTAVDQITVSTASLVAGTFLGADPSFCAGSDLLLDAGAGHMSYAWNTGAQDQYLLVNAAGQYNVLIVDSLGCQYTDTVLVSVVNPPALELGPGVDICPGETATLDAGAGFGTYLWSTGETTPSISTLNPGGYSITVTSGICTLTDEVYVTDNCPANLIVPNVFTPNGDGINDVFLPKTEGLTEYHLVVFDRWHRELFETLTVTTGWNGTLNGNDVPEGVYFYHIDFKTKGNENLQWRDGSITLMR